MPARLPNEIICVCVRHSEQNLPPFELRYVCLLKELTDFIENVKDQRH